jgi:hypothetical protein
MGYLERQRAWQEEDERRSKEWRKFLELNDKHWERVHDVGSFYAWFILIIISFLYSAYSMYGVCRIISLRYRPLPPLRRWGRRRKTPNPSKELSGSALPKTGRGRAFRSFAAGWVLSGLKT